jgi:hypothetical protein
MCLALPAGIGARGAADLLQGALDRLLNSGGSSSGGLKEEELHRVKKAARVGLLGTLQVRTRG